VRKEKKAHRQMMRGGVMVAKLIKNAAEHEKALSMIGLPALSITLLAVSLSHSRCLLLWQNQQQGCVMA
jgi:hypothetical protein